VRCDRRRSGPVPADNAMKAVEALYEKLAAELLKS
jgi:hypothetical protein